MADIQVLDQVTIDKIAAGEVIERPASIVKELVENAIDAGATAVTVEIRDGGISFIRVTDNGCGISRQEVALAFLRHSTSKIRSVSDLETVASLGFRGEALSSIAAVAQVELVTKRREDVLGVRYQIEGGKEKSIEDCGARDGSVFLVRNLFYNTPARRKFLKTAMTEAGHVHEVLTRLALSHPEISFAFINNGQTRLHTSGNGSVKDAVYGLFGREVAMNLLTAEYALDGLKVTGYIGKPVVSRGNRGYENYFVNGRYVKSSIISKAIEDACKGHMMQHQYPFTALHFTMDGSGIDVNVHPTKMELRFGSPQRIYDFVYEAVRRAFAEKELIPEVSVPAPKPIAPENETTAASPLPERTKPPEKPSREKDLAYYMQKMRERVTAYHAKKGMVQETQTYAATDTEPQMTAAPVEPGPKKSAAPAEPPRQLDLFEEKFLQREPAQEHTIIGQVFGTYWLVEYRDQLYIIDQHAAHERVLYEKTMRGMKTRTFTSQYLSPPIILTLSMQEEAALKAHMDSFSAIGFEIEPFGGTSYAVRAVPDNLFHIAKKDLLMEMLDDLADGVDSSLAPDLVTEKIASLSCKAAVKGNHKLSAAEAEALIGELLQLENPYQCPHGRPTIISMSRRELEKKFKRIV